MSKMRAGQWYAAAALRRLFHRALLIVVLAAFVRPVPAADTTIRFEVALPENADSNTLIWGLTRGGIELSHGHQRIGGATGSTPGFDAVVSVAMPPQDPPLLAHLCINRDEWESYTASFGDSFAIVPVRDLGGRWTARVQANEWRRRDSQSPESRLTVHYHRFEDDYADVSLWTWDERLSRAPGDNELAPVGRDKFGVAFQLDTSLYGTRGDRVGLLPRLNRDWSLKDGPDRFWAPQMGSEVFLLQGSPDVTTTAPNARPRLVAATLDAERRITVRFSHRVPAADWPKEKFRLMYKDGQQLDVRSVEPDLARVQGPHDGRSAVFAIETTEPPDLARQEITLEADGCGRQAVRFGRFLEDPARFYDAGAVLGATWTPDATTFRVFAPTATEVRVVVADALESHAGLTERPMRRNPKGVWEATIVKDLEGKYYAYKLRGPGLNPEREVTDIHATCTQGDYARSLIVDLSKTDPPGFRDGSDRAPISPVDAVIYELHVRDFTIAPNAGARHKGLYLGLTEVGTHLPENAAVKTGLDHLVELGVTHVQLLPIQDSDNHEALEPTINPRGAGSGYNWGYMTVHFNSPDGWYATRASGPAKIREFKQAVAALHARGIGVIMDVVYNHTAERASFERLVPGYYFRLNDAGQFSNGSGCGNEFKSENPMARKFLLDSLSYWVREYQVDGFRFDLMGLMDLETLKQIRATLTQLRPGILLYGEPWTSGATPLSPISDHQQVRGTGLGAFNDHLRDAIKGDRDGGAAGFIQVGDRLEAIQKGLEGAIHDWAETPFDPIQYFEAHDNLTAWDKLLQSVPKASDAHREQMMRFAAMLLLTAQGRPFLHAGQEFCRTKQGNANSYNAPDAINQIDWSRKTRYAGVFSYHKGMIALRKAHPVLRLRTREEVERRVSFGKAPNDRCIAYRLDAAELDGESAKELLVLLNGGLTEAKFPLASGTWSVLADAERAGTEELGTAREQIAVPAHSGVVLMH